MNIEIFNNCIVCNKQLKGKQSKFCSKKCKGVFYENKNKNLISQKLRGLNRKIEFVLLAGGCCNKCGYDKNLSVLCFHHIDENTKLFGLSQSKLRAKPFIECLEEFNKCQLLCHNCHMTIHYPEFNNWQSFIINEFYLKNEELKIKIQNKCINCNINIHKNSITCRNCASKERSFKIVWPSIEELLILLETYNYTSLGKKLGVSDNAIRKHIKNYK